MKQYEWWITLDHTSHSGLCHTRGGTQWSGSSQQVAAFQHLRLRHVKARCSGSNPTMCFRFFLLCSHKFTTQKNRKRQIHSHKFINLLHNSLWGEWYLVCLLCTFERCLLSFCYSAENTSSPRHFCDLGGCERLKKTEAESRVVKCCECLWMLCYVVDLLPFHFWLSDKVC